MANNIIIDSLVSVFNNEISNEIQEKDNKIIITLKDGSKVKITAKNVA